MSWRDRDWSKSDRTGGWGGGGSLFRENPMAWAPTIGTVSGIRVQLHILFLIYMAIELLRSIGTPSGLWIALRYQVMLFGLVFLHEMGHCFGCRYVRGSATNILMWPLGGLASVDPPHQPGAHLVTTVAGPLVNFAFCVLSGLVLIARTGTPLAIPWNPFEPRGLIFTEFDFWILQFFYVNYILLLFNVCLPVFPFDGGRIFQALCWYRMGYRRSMLLATTVGMVGAVGLGCYGLFTQSFLLIGIAVFGYITSMQQRRLALASSPFGDQPYDLSAAHPQPYAPPRAKRPGTWARKQKRLADEQADLNRILAKVHDQGLASLSRKEKRALARATKRQQERERQLGRIDRL